MCECVCLLLASCCFIDIICWNFQKILKAKGMPFNDMDWNPSWTLILTFGEMILTFAHIFLVAIVIIKYT